MSFTLTTQEHKAGITGKDSIYCRRSEVLREIWRVPSSNQCGSAEYPGEAIPYHPSLPKADPGHWWASFF